MRTLFYYGLSLVVLCSCNRQAKSGYSDSTISSVDTSLVVSEGMMITGAVFRILGTNLQQALADSGVSGALQFCNNKAIPLTDSLSQRYEVTVRRASHRPRNPGNRVDSLEMASIKKYLEQLKASEKLNPLVYTTGKKIIYHAPIHIAGPLCMNCHGSPGTDISSADLMVIIELYPEDEATGFSIGDLRGIWVIEFPEAYFKSKVGIEGE